MKHVLVIGGAGYVGSHTCLALAEAGFRPVTYDNLSVGHRDFVRWGPFVHGDMADTAHIVETIDAYEIIGVMHFAARAAVGESVIHPAEYYYDNVNGTLSVLKAVRQAGCLPLVFSSSCAIYGEPKIAPITEHSEARPINPYGRTKLVCEQMLGDFSQAYGLQSISLRYFNAAGASPGGLIGEKRDPEPHIIPRAIMHALGQLPEFQIFGGDFDTPDGTAIRDYTHVSDLAEAHVAALRLLLRGHGIDAFNLGTGRGSSILDVLKVVEKVSGRQMPKVAGARRPGDPSVLVADPSRAKNILGFDPKLSLLATIVETAWKWHTSTNTRTSTEALTEQVLEQA
jgi:UDP-glucose-4-epimerase GalE